MTLKELREAKGKTPSEVARAMGMTPHNIYRFEASGTTYVTTLEEYAAALDCPVMEVWEASRETRRQAVTQQSTSPAATTAPA